MSFRMAARLLITGGVNANSSSEPSPIRSMMGLRPPRFLFEVEAFGPVILSKFLVSIFQGLPNKKRERDIDTNI